jgi:hypothetical protein
VTKKKKFNNVATWFYKHAETFMNSDGADYEYIPTVDFFHRHNRWISFRIRSMPIEWGDMRGFTRVGQV